MELVVKVVIKRKKNNCMIGNLVWKKGRGAVDFEKDENGYWERSDDWKIIPYHKSAMNEMLERKNSLIKPNENNMQDNFWNDERVKEFMACFDHLYPHQIFDVDRLKDLAIKNFRESKQQGNSDTVDYVITALVHNKIIYKNKMENSITPNAYYDVHYEGWVSMDNGGKGAEIYSVKRVADNLEFSVDEIAVVNMCVPTDVKIKKFEEKEIEFSARKYILVTLEQYGSTQELKLDLSELTKKKEKQSLFTTEDGVYIFDSDCFYGLNETWHTARVCGAQEDSEKRFWKTFSTNEKLEEYILQHQEKLSLADLEPFLQYYVIWKDIIELAKQKLK